MITIQGEDYIIKQSLEGSKHFDLWLPKVINKGKENERVEFKDPSYGMTLLSAIESIILHRLNTKKEVYTLKEFIKEYKEERIKLEKIIYE